MSKIYDYYRDALYDDKGNIKPRPVMIGAGGTAAGLAMAMAYPGLRRGFLKGMAKVNAGIKAMEEAYSVDKAVDHALATRGMPPMPKVKVAHNKVTEVIHRTHDLAHIGHNTIGQTDVFHRGLDFIKSRIHNTISAPRLTAVIIEGNRDYMRGAGRTLMDPFYNDIQRYLESKGYSVKRDPGEAYTSPPKADLWIGHSRGVDRLRFAPKGVRVLAFGSQNTTGIPVVNHPMEPKLSKPPLSLTAKERDQHIKDPGQKYHFMFTQAMKSAIDSITEEILKKKAKTASYDFKKMHTEPEEALPALTGTAAFYASKLKKVSAPKRLALTAAGIGLGELGARLSVGTKKRRRLISDRDYKRITANDPVTVKWRPKFMRRMELETELLNKGPKAFNEKYFKSGYTNNFSTPAQLHYIIKDKTKT